ncbi:hypothetical protein L195_g046334, partial [Trifolium pratense]
RNGLGWQRRLLNGDVSASGRELMMVDDGGELDDSGHCVGGEGYMQSC